MSLILVFFFPGKCVQLKEESCNFQVSIEVVAMCDKELCWEIEASGFSPL